MAIFFMMAIWEPELSIFFPKAENYRKGNSEFRSLCVLIFVQVNESKVFVFSGGWWISWSPFVGMFVAKVSRGRSIKDFILYTLTLPCLYSFLWLTVFGGAAIRYENLARNAGLNWTMYNETAYNFSLVLSKDQQAL